MNNKSKIIPLKIKLMIAFSIVVIISLLIQVGISYFFLYDVVEKKTTENYKQTIIQANRRIDESLYSYEKITRNIIANNIIQDCLRNIMNDEFSDANLKIKQELAKITISDENINSIHIVPKDYKTISYIFMSNYADYDANKKLPWFNKVKNSTGEVIWGKTMPINKVMIGNIETYVFSAIRKINDINTGKELGIVIVNIDAKHLKNIIDEIELGENGDIYLIDNENTIVYFKNQDLIGEKLDIDYDKDNIVVSDISLKSNWKLIGIVPKNSYRKEIEQFNRIFLCFSIIAILTIIIFSVIISKSIESPINNLIDAMKQVQKGNLNVNIIKKQKNEIGILANHFEEMIDELKYFIDKVYKQEIINREAEIKALHAQLNPHFLYNTLDTIYWMLIIKEEEEIGDLVVALANILRYSISRGEEFVTIKEDIEQLRNYLYIQKTRFEDKLIVDIDISNCIDDYTIPKLLLQPLVENSINHGFKKMKINGKIHIKGYIDNNEIIFEVIDNGIGMSHEKIKNIFNGKLKVDNKHTGLGLKAVDERIKIIYGCQYGLNISSVPNEYTHVKVTLPIK
ncbi:MAG: sensor histidine kinase [Vallitalea sp.]|jgi:two-component system sensor histidine kinase YesM|nr:sensor histidine kinase [Vallitalea sp.]